MSKFWQNDRLVIGNLICQLPVLFTIMEYGIWNIEYVIINDNEHRLSMMYSCYVLLSN